MLDFSGGNPPAKKQKLSMDPSTPFVDSTPPIVHGNYNIIHITGASKDKRYSFLNGELSSRPFKSEDVEGSDVVVQINYDRVVES